MLVTKIAGTACNLPLKASAAGGDLGTELVRTLDGTVYAVESGTPSVLVIEADGGTAPCGMADARRIVTLHLTKALFTITVRNDLGDILIYPGCRIIERPQLVQIGKRPFCTYKFKVITGVTAWI